MGALAKYEDGSEFGRNGPDSLTPEQRERWRQKMSAAHGSPEYRLLSRLRREGDCFVYAGSRTECGYGQIGYQGRVVKTHRLAYALLVGAVPDGAHVLHRCDNPPCCNPAHLFLGDNVINIQDRAQKGRSWGGGSAPAIPKHIRDRALALLAEGHGASEIGRMLGVRRRTVVQWKARAKK